MFASIRRAFAGLLDRRHGGVLVFVLLFVAVAAATRLALLAQARWVVNWDASLLAAFAWGFVFDLGAALWWASPLVLVLAVLPARTFERRWARAGAHLAGIAALYALLFGAVAEWLFWNEFGGRFNFIAVDYLVYTTEVLANIRESYPLTAIFAGLGLATFGLSALWLRTGLVQRWLAHPAEAWRPRWTAALAWAIAIAAVGGLLQSEALPAFANNYHRELAKNGGWSLFAAFRNNELDYDRFYRTVPIDEAFATLRAEFAEHDGAAAAAQTPAPRDTLRWVAAPRHGPELQPNVIQITVESLSAEFVGALNAASRLTPNLDALAAKSLVFENVYATGTRTDRGMEALTLALPPTPGRSLVKRPRNADLFTLGSVFRSRGYDTAFVYGGYGYFDNMNAFFGGNGYRIVDRASVAKSDITFANAWGACDEDVFRWTVREADAAHAAGKPFHYFVMTTSNHRPYTYPDGKIDLPSKVSGRDGAVRYTDYAIGRLIAEAAERPWFKDTVFVIVADHCASVAGRAALPVQNYHIPLLIYAPGGQVAPGRVPDLMSQVDYAPTLLGLLNWSYASRFFGWDVINTKGDRRALIGNYQQLGLYEPGLLHVLKPVNQQVRYRCDRDGRELRPERSDEAIARETIAYYQTASYLYRHGLYRALTREEQLRYPRPARPAPGANVATLDTPAPGAKLGP